MLSRETSLRSQNTEGMGNCALLTKAFEMGDPFIFRLS